jgi:putative ABC transport system permease protein
MVWTDLRYVARSLRRAPAFTSAAILTLALGIGANTAIFSVVNTIMLRPLPFGSPDRLMQVGEKNDKLRLPSFAVSNLNYLSFQERSRSFERMGAYGFGNFTLTGAGEPEQFPGAPITPSLLDVLGIKPVRGRAFADEEGRPGGARVAMIGESLWQRRFAADPSIIGLSVRLNDLPYTVVGIAPRALTLLTNADIWIPHVIDPPRENRLNHILGVVGLLKNGVTERQARAELSQVSFEMGRDYPEIKDWGVTVTSFRDSFVPSQLARALVVLLAAVTLVLLIACANVANLLLARAAGREKEIAVRIAMGARRARVVRQLLTESLALAALGGACGVLAAYWALRLMTTALPPNTLPFPEIGLDARVLLFGLAITLATGLLFGLAPAWQTARADLNDVLKRSGRGSSGAARPWLRSALVAGELATATVLLIGAGLLIRSLLALLHVPVGFQPEGLMTFQLSPPPTKYPPPAKSWVLYKSLLDSLTVLPGVKAAAISSGLPFGAGTYTTSPSKPVGESQLPAGDSLPIEYRQVSPDYFRALEIPHLRGRMFSDQDRHDAPLVTLVSERTARTLWGDRDPVGRQLQIVSSKIVFTVIGVVGDTRSTRLSTEPNPQMYFPAAWRQWPRMDIVVRTAGRPETIVPAVRAAVRQLDPELPLTNVRTMNEWIANSAANQRFNGLLLGMFAAVALVIAAVGIYGVLAYSVTQRTRELGVRLALGAQPGDVRRMVIREGMKLGLTGIAVGLAGAVALSHLLTALLFGIQPRDPATFGAVAAILIAIALAACYIPARRATRIDPVVALRDE